MFIHSCITIKVHGLNWLLISASHKMKARKVSNQNSFVAMLFFPPPNSRPRSTIATRISLYSSTYFISELMHVSG